MRRAAALALLALAGCGGDDGARAPTTAAKPPAAEDPAPSGNAPQRVLVAALGDSITAGYPLWDPDPELRRNIGAARDRRSQYEYWARRKLGRHVRFRNCGVPGDRTDQIAARLDQCAKGADVVIVQGGLNDIAQGRPVADAARDLRAMVRHGKRLRLRVAIAELLPWNNGYPRFRAQVDDLNRRIHALARAERVRVLPWYRALEDPAKPDRMRDALTAEGDHPSVAGYRRIGEAVTLPGG
jgi:lysophospholipase L1-like esterase